jgi:hypothetical protein
MIRRLLLYLVNYRTHHVKYVNPSTVSKLCTSDKYGVGALTSIATTPTHQQVQSSVLSSQNLYSSSLRFSRVSAS